MLMSSKMTQCCEEVVRLACLSWQRGVHILSFAMFSLCWSYLRMFLHIPGNKVLVDFGNLSSWDCLVAVINPNRSPQYSTLQIIESKQTNLTLLFKLLVKLKLKQTAF